MFKINRSQAQRRAGALIKPTIEDDTHGLFPSEFTSRFMNMPADGELDRFSFKGRGYLVPVYDTPARRVLLMCGRQVEKSTTLGNQILSYASLRRFFRSLYVSPTETQTTTFSRDKIAAPIKYSEKLQFLKGRSPAYADNVLFKEFVTDCDITLRYAFLHADRIRGISADLLCLDELQDLLIDVIPVIEESLSHSKHKILRYAGTPKSFDNTIAGYWENYSTQNEWVIPCDGCNHWNVPGETNIGLKWLICSKCGNQIYSTHDNAQWASMRSADWLLNPRDGKGSSLTEVFEGYRIPQIIVEWIEWHEILDKRVRYGRSKFINEVLGQAHDSADKLLSKTSLQKNCRTDLRLDEYKKWIGRVPLYMGVDWGGDGISETSFTVLSIGGYFGGHFTYIYFKRYEGREADKDFMMSDIARIAREFRVTLIGTDHGGGQDKNYDLIKEFGRRRVIPYQYVNTKMMYFDKSLMRFMVNRTEMLMALVNALNAGNKIKLPKWEDIANPFMSDCMSVFREYDSKGIKVQIQHTPGASDDTLHSMLYCLLTSMIQQPNPDIIAPMGVRE